VFNNYHELLPQKAFDMFSRLPPSLSKMHPEYYQEMQGIQEVIGLRLEDTLALNYLYEFEAFCTSIVAR
jgi:hypothetical protein